MTKISKIGMLVAVIATVSLVVWVLHALIPIAQSLQGIH